MKSLLFPIVLLIIGLLNSCCLGNAKCNITDFNAAITMFDKTSNRNLIFGSNRLYDNTKIRFYSLQDQDTIFHSCRPLPVAGTANDSTLSVMFDTRKFNNIYIKLNDTDVDTLMMNYQLINASPCCDDYYRMSPVSYNGNAFNLYYVKNDITLLK